MERDLYKPLEEHLSTQQITLLVGARQTGKTTLLRQLQDFLKNKNKPVFFLSLEDRQILTELNESPKNLFRLIPPLREGERTYVLIDEVQYLDDPSNFLKYHYDSSGNHLKFVVSGSSHFYIDRKFKDSMAGRKRIFELPTMDLAEVLRFRGRDDLAPFVGSGNIPLVYKDEVMHQFYDYLVYGGYPAVVLASDDSEKRGILKELRNAYARKDVVEANLQHPDLYFKLMKIMADQIGSQINANPLATELGADNKTIRSYLWVMQKSFHIHTVAPFYKRVANELRKMPKLYFADLGLRNSLLNNFAPIGNRDDKGALLENYAYLRLKQVAEEDSIKYWRTRNRQEVDFIVQRDDGMASAYEVKWRTAAFTPSKYRFFQKQYPEIPLSCISLENAFEIRLGADDQQQKR